MHRVAREEDAAGKSVGKVWCTAYTSAAPEPTRMACLTCRSDWLTLHGRNCRRCPHCCKLARCRERKRGRWQDPLIPKRCAQCGTPFSVEGLGKSHQKFCSRECGASVPRRRNRRPCGSDARTGRRWSCVYCGKQFVRSVCEASKAKYCSRECFFRARADGTQTWDRSSQLHASRHRGDSRRVAAHAEALTLAFTSYVAKLESLVREMQRNWWCRHCGKLLNSGSEYCSLKCSANRQALKSCICCHQEFVGGMRTRRCQACAHQHARLLKRRRKREEGSYRKRCRKHGGYYNSQCKRSAIFERDRYICHVCGKRTKNIKSVYDPRAATVDHHPVPLSKGGDHDWHNVRCACRQCNWEKSDEWDRQLRMNILRSTPQPKTPPE